MKTLNEMLDDAMMAAAAAELAYDMAFDAGKGVEKAKREWVAAQAAVDAAWEAVRLAEKGAA